MSSVLLTDDQPEEKNNRRSGDNTPWWITALYKLGVPTAIAIFLIWFITSQVVPNVQYIKDNLTLHAESASRANTDMIKQNEKLMRVLQQICANGAKNNQERSNCFQ